MNNDGIMVDDWCKASENRYELCSPWPPDFTVCDKDWLELRVATQLDAFKASAAKILCHINRGGIELDSKQLYTPAITIWRWPP